MYEIRVASVLLWVSCLSAATCVAGSLDPDFHVPATVRSEQSADLVRRVQSAFVALYEACRRHDREGVEAAMSSDGTLEYALKQGEVHAAVDVIALSAACTEQDSSEQVPIATLWVFPTADLNTAFVQYTFVANEASAGRGSTHMARIELKGIHISKIRYLSETLPPDVLLAAANAATPHGPRGP